MDETCPLCTGGRGGEHSHLLKEPGEAAGAHSPILAAAAAVAAAAAAAAPRQLARGRGAAQRRRHEREQWGARARANGSKCSNGSKRALPDLATALAGQERRRRRRALGRVRRPPPTLSCPPLRLLPDSPRAPAPRAPSTRGGGGEQRRDWWDPRPAARAMSAPRHQRRDRWNGHAPRAPRARRVRHRRRSFVRS